MPDNDEPAAEESEPLTTREDSLALAEEQIRAEVNAPTQTVAQQQRIEELQSAVASSMQRYIGEPLTAETIAQMQTGLVSQLEVLRTTAQQIAEETDNEFLARVRETVNPDRCNICGALVCRHLRNGVQPIYPQTTNNGLIETDFHTSHDGIRYPAIDRLVGSTVWLQDHRGGYQTATATIYYEEYSQIIDHFDIGVNNDLLPRRMVWYRGEYWIVDSTLVANTVHNGYEVTLEMTCAVAAAISNIIPYPSRTLTLTEASNGQTEWVLAEPAPVNTISLDLTINNGMSIANTGALTQVDFEEAGAEPSTVLKKAKCPVCQKRGCASSHHIPTAAELEQSLNSTADMLHAEALNENQSAAVRTAFETAINQIDLAQQLNAVARMRDVQESFLPLRMPESPILGTVVEQHGDTSYIQLGNNTTIAHVTGPVAVGTRITWDTEGHLTPINPQSYSAPNP